MASSVQTDDPIKCSFLDHFSCKICLETLKEPVQCQRNEHYFCTSCITKHLKRSQTCPLCMEGLTEQTLRPIPRIVADLLSQFEAPLCKYVSRGCKEVVKHQDLPFHHEVCGFAPVVCSNEGCCKTINKQDKASHEEESCRFRVTKCGVCAEEMVYRDFEKHSCVLRKELDEVKLWLTEIGQSLKEIHKELKDHNESIKILQDPLRSASSSLFRHERTIIANGQIVVAGGHDRATMKSYEVLNWSTKSWTLFENALFFDHTYSFSFPYDDKILVCGGKRSERIEYLDIVSSKASVVFPASLPSSTSGKGALCGKSILTFEDSIRKTFLMPPHSSSVVFKYKTGEKRDHYGVECLNQSVAIVGGNCTETTYTFFETKVDDVILYDLVKNEVKKLAPLPYRVSMIATVPYQDNIIILGGLDGKRKLLNNVLMYNVTTQECKQLPSMLQSRAGCAAVIMGDVIVAMGGLSNTGAINTVEYLVLGQDTWKELPPMHCKREGATASVQV